MINDNVMAISITICPTKSWFENGYVKCGKGQLQEKKLCLTRANFLAVIVEPFNC